MHRNTIWYKSLLDAEKSCLKDEKIKKVHYKFQDEKEMVEEYNVDTQVMLRRAWKVKGKLGGEGKWEVEVGDPMPDAMSNVDTLDLIQSSDQIYRMDIGPAVDILWLMNGWNQHKPRTYISTHKVAWMILPRQQDCARCKLLPTILTGDLLRRALSSCGHAIALKNNKQQCQPNLIYDRDEPILSRRNTRINLEWRIRNLPYPIETYSISANNEERCIVVRTTNKKYFKKLQVPELMRLNLPIEQANIQSTHTFNTLIISYKKPQQLIDMEKDWYEELKKVKPVKDIPNDCKPQ